METLEIGDNVTAQIVDGKLVLTIDPTQSFGESSSKKSLIIASSRGNVRLPRQFSESLAGIQIGINVFKPL